MQTAPLNPPRRDLFPALSVTYLAVPSLIFLLGWLRPAIGLPVALVVAGGAVWFWIKPGPATRPALTQKNLLLVLTAAFLWTLLTGVGGVVPQSNDYVKHNLLLHDLASSTWPVIYPHAGGGTYLCYALGYYLVPALGSRWLGADALSAITFAWTFAGLFLFFWWAVRLTKSPGKTLAAIFLFAPTGILWALFKAHGLPGVITPAALVPKLFNGGLQFTFDSFSRFNYQPQHALIGWLGTALLYELLWEQKNPRGTIFVWVLCGFCSPLTSVGLLLVPLAAGRRVRWQSYWEPVNVAAGGSLLVILGLYFQGHLPLPDRGFIGTLLPGVEWIFYYALFLLLMFLPLLFLWLVERRDQSLGEWRPLFFGSLAVLLLLPLYKLGLYSDLRLQAGAPALLLLALATVRLIESPKFSFTRPLSLLLAGGLVVGALHPAAHLVQNLLAPPVDYSYENITKSLGWHSLADLNNPQNYDTAAQYEGRGDSPAARWLLLPAAGLNP